MVHAHMKVQGSLRMEPGSRVLTAQMMPRLDMQVSTGSCGTCAQILNSSFVTAPPIGTEPQAYSATLTQAFARSTRRRGLLKDSWHQHSCQTE